LSVMPLGFCRLGWPHQSSAAVPFTPFSTW